MSGDRNSIVCSHCVSFAFSWGYCRLLRVFAFYVQCLTIAGVSLNLQKKLKFHKLLGAV